jgi:hypothetical protein
MDRAALLESGSEFIHGTMHAINAIVTKRVAKTAPLVTEGQETSNSYCHPGKAGETLNL